MTDFYVYIHTRNDTGEVFYVGKGCKDRAFCNDRSSHWKNIVAKHGRTVHIIARYTLEDDSFAMETYLIYSYIALGVKLCNVTLGGGGTTGFKWPEEARKKLSVSHSGRTCSTEHKLKVSHTLKQRAANPEVKNELKAQALKRWQDPAYRDKMKQGQACRKPPTPETLAKMSASQTARWKNKTNRTD